MSSNIMSTQPLTFGIELEMSIAYWPYQNQPLPTPTPTQKPTHKLDFYPTDADHSDYEALQKSLGQASGNRRDHYHKAATINCKKAITKLLGEAGLPVGTEIKVESALGDYSVWEVVEDVSIGQPKTENPYKWFQIEMRSPAYVFNAENLAAVEKVCNLMKENFLVDTSDGEKKANIKIVSALLKPCIVDTPLVVKAVVYTSTLEGDNSASMINISETCQHRFNSIYCLSAREKSRYAQKYLQKYGSRPSPITGVRHFQEDKDLEWTAYQAGGYNESQLKYAAVNVEGLVEGARGMSDAKPTIEWRQHEGTIDAERVTTWVETVVGIVNFACHAPRQDLHTLLSMAANEHWEKLGDGQDRKRERKMGAIIAESWFKAADLFEWMGLTKFADFYRDRTYIIEKFCAAEPYARWITWDYEKKDIILSKEEKESLHVRRELFDCLRKMKLDENSDIKFDPNDPFWPPHQDQKEGMAQDTDASSPRLEGSSLSSGPSERSEPKSEGLEDSGSSSDEEFKLKAEENSIYRIEKEAKRAAKLETKRKEADGEEEFDESEDVIE